MPIERGMAVSRPTLLGIVGALLIVLVFAATRAMNAGDGADEPEPPAPSPQAASPPGAKSKAAPAPASKSRDARSKPDPKTRTSSTTAPADRAAGLPADVARALGRRKPVVLFFQQRGADDAAVRDAVRGLAKRGRTPVFTDSVRRIDDYELILGELEISQGPAVVIVNRSRKARVIEGFVDEGTLAQGLRDATR